MDTKSMGSECHEWLFVNMKNSGSSMSLTITLTLGLTLKHTYTINPNRYSRPK